VKLSASTAASGPHDFAVRFRRVRLAPFASIASHRTFVTMANAPHPPRDGRSYVASDNASLVKWGPVATEIGIGFASGR
jgi:hypothetical protein